jgi:hypothetical protein
MSVNPKARYQFGDLGVDGGNIVAYRPVARQRPRNGQGDNSLSNGAVNTSLLLEAVFCTRSVQRGYLEDNGGDPVACQLSVETWILHGRLWR